MSVIALLFCGSLGFVAGVDLCLVLCEMLWIMPYLVFICYLCCFVCYKLVDWCWLLCVDFVGCILVICCLT